MSATNQTFVSKYIRKLVKSGIDEPDSIVEEAKKEIIEIDKQLAEADKLRSRRMGLYSVLTYYGERSTTPTSRFSPILLDDDSDAAKELRLQVIASLEEHKQLSNSEIIEKLGQQQDHRSVVRAIKWLGEKGIVEFARSEEFGKRLVPGPEWDKARELMS